MDEARALSIVSALANGVNPLTGEVFPGDSPYQTADVVRALLLVVRGMEGRSHPQRRQSQTCANAGKSWTKEEDEKLLMAFAQGLKLAEIAKTHGRTVAGIEARLEKHGRLDGTARRAFTR